MQINDPSNATLHLETRNFRKILLRNELLATPRPVVTAETESIKVNRGGAVALVGGLADREI